jgi:hypothetical protein
MIFSSSRFQMSPQEGQSRLSALASKCWKVRTWEEPMRVGAGNTEFNNWLAVCVGPEKVVRVVSSNDIVPFARGSYQVMQASNVIEVYNPDATRNVWRRCQGGNDPFCSAGLNCRERSWENHMRYGGVYFGSAMCRPSTPSSK